jgi:CRP-like cAMP-binding protein
MLELCAHLPEVELAAGEVLVEDGTRTGGIWVLVSGELAVSKHGVTVNSISHPGALIGEVSVLLGAAHTATVTATRPSRLRHAADGASLMSTDPAISHFVATGLAERLDFVTTYLADLRNQYGDAPGLAMVPDVLRRLAARHGPPAAPGSARDPDPDY